MLWIKIEVYYGKGLLYIASKSTAFVKNVEFEKIKLIKDSRLNAQFLIKHKKGVRIIFKFDFSTFTFNVPLTFAIMATLYSYTRNRKRAYIEALLLLFLIHFLHTFTNETGRLSYIMARNNLETASEFQLFIWQYLWGFLDSMVIRFEPFLIGIYMLIRFRIREI